MAAAVAFVLQGIVVVASEAATGDASHYYLGFAIDHADGAHHSHLVTHRHADGIVHRHAVDDDDDALAKHGKQPGWNMMLVVCVVPCASGSSLSYILADELRMDDTHPFKIAARHRLKRPPRPPGIA
jgi:hypothetical protein